MKRIHLVYVGIAILLLALFIGAWMTRDVLWKTYLHHIDTAHFFDACERHDNFVGMEIEEVLKIVTKNEYYMIFDRQTEYRGRNYDQWSAQYPRIALNDTSKVALYCIPVENSHSREESFWKGFFVDSNGLVSDGPIDPPF